MGSFRLTAEPAGTNTVTNMTLHSQDSSYGIKRDSDSVIIIPDNTPMTAVGDNTYEFSSTLLDPLISYTASIFVEYSDLTTEFVIAALAGIENRHTLRSLRRALARRVGGGYYAGTTDSIAPSQDSIKDSALIDNELPENTYNEMFTYIRTGLSAGEQKRIKSDGFIPTAGQINAVSSFSNTIQSGIDYEIFGALPAIEGYGTNGFRECINQALEILFTIDRITMPTPVNQLSDLNSFDWITNASQIIGVYGANEADGAGFTYGPYFKFRYDAERPTLVGPTLTASDITSNRIQFGAYRPLNTWIKKGGVWQESDGLVDDSDECLGDPICIREVAYYFALRALENSPWISVSEKQEYGQKADRQAVIAYNIKRNTDPKDTGSESQYRLGIPGMKGWMGY